MANLYEQAKEEIEQREKEHIKQAKLELARRNFYTYCQLRVPKFYKDDRVYLKNLCDEMQDFTNSDDEILIINIAPRHGKSVTAGRLVEWLLGNDPDLSIMTASYNETLSTMFSEGVRNTIKEEKLEEDIIYYSDIFPDVAIKYGDSAKQYWSLEGKPVKTYMATSPSGTSTGIGADYLVIDDIIKNDSEVYNDNITSKHWNWYANTMQQRKEEGAKEIIIMTRWGYNDLAGKITNHCEENNVRYRVYKEDVKNKDGSMLCEEILSKKSYERRKKIMGNDIFMANYHQEPIELKGRLYTSFKTYDNIPKENGTPLFEKILNYTDTADTGKDYLCSINYGVYNNQAYILDILYTKKPMEITEPETAKMLYNDDVAEAVIESNNGGRGFARQVERHLKETYNSNRTRISWFHQSENKKARILSNSTRVMENILFPKNWKMLYPDFYTHINAYQKEGTNQIDDGADCLTGIIETMEKSKKQRIKSIPKSLLGL